MYGISNIRSVSVGLDSQIWYLFIYITGYLNVRKISETMDFRTFVGPLITIKARLLSAYVAHKHGPRYVKGRTETKMLEMKSWVLAEKI